MNNIRAELGTSRALQMIGATFERPFARSVNFFGDNLHTLNTFGHILLEIRFDAYNTLVYIALFDRFAYLLVPETMFNNGSAIMRIG